MRIGQPFMSITIHPDGAASPVMTGKYQPDVAHFWSKELALPAGFHPKAQEVHVVAQDLYAGVQFFQREDWLVLAAPPQRMAAIAERVSGKAVREIYTVEYVECLLSPDVGRILGPAYVSYADAANFRLSPTNGCRLLTSNDAAICEELEASLMPEEIEQSGFDAHGSPAFGSFADGVLCAVARYQVWKPCIAHITVATRPEHRRRGHGRAAVSALAEHALAQDLVLQYRALAVNGNSLATGRALGFQHYCSTIYARPAGA